MVADGMNLDSDIFVASAQVSCDEGWCSVDGVARADKASDEEKKVLRDASAKKT